MGIHPAFSYLFAFIVKLGKSLVLQQCRARDNKTSKPVGHCMTTTMSVSVSHCSRLSCVHCLILEMEKSTRCMNFTESQK